MVSAKLDFGSRFTHSFSTNGPRYEAQYRTWYSLSAPSVQSRAVDTVVYFRFDSVYCPWPAALLHCSTLQRYCSQLYVHSWYGTKLVWIYWYTRRPCLIYTSSPVTHRTSSVSAIWLYSRTNAVHFRMRSKLIKPQPLRTAPRLIYRGRNFYGVHTQVFMARRRMQPIKIAQRSIETTSQ
jgi:hypothetical protein